MRQTHQYITRAKTSPGRKARKGQLKRIRKGSRNPGATGQGSIRRPF